jgi:hypothetical protein
VDGAEEPWSPAPREKVRRLFAEEQRAEAGRDELALLLDKEPLLRQPHVKCRNVARLTEHGAVLLQRHGIEIVKASTALRGLELLQRGGLLAVTLARNRRAHLGLCDELALHLADALLQITSEEVDLHAVVLRVLDAIRC